MAISATADSVEAAGAVRWSFAGVVLDERTLELRRDGELLELEHKPLEVLMFLLRHAGEVVTRAELAEQVWARRVMDEQAISRAVLKLRSALGDSQQNIVRTVHGHGYRLVAPVRVEAHPASAPLLRLDLKQGDCPPLRPLWKLELSLGAGGYGEVWLARHDKTHEPRVFKFAADGPALTALRREITLYRLIHDSLGERPDVVRLLDWNLEAPPYFVESEYIAGGSLLQWAEGQGGLAGIELATRLELMAQIADALGAVYRVGVLHKDLKPANVVVAAAPVGGPQAKLPDFGSGRVLDERRLQELGITRLGFTHAIATDSTSSGTPQYLAPEVVAGQPLTVQADIYALGVMLYQIVVADFGAPLAPGWERNVGDELLREDIALAADGNPARRLADASELARRLRGLEQRRRQLGEQRAASARAEAAARALDRFKARRAGFVTAIAVLLLGLAVSLKLYSDAHAARWLAEVNTARAQQQAAAAEALSDFLTKDVFAGFDPGQRDVKDLKVKDLLDAADAKIDQRFDRQPLLAARMRMRVALAYDAIGYGADGYRLARKVLEQARQSLERSDAEALDLGAFYVQNRLGAFVEEDCAYLQRLSAIARTSWGEQRAETLQILAGAAQCDYAVWNDREAAQELRSVIAAARQSPAVDRKFIYKQLFWLGGVDTKLGDFAGAEAALREAIDLAGRNESPRADLMLRMHASLGEVLIAGGKYGEADAELSSALAMARETRSARDQNVLSLVYELGHLRTMQGRYAEAQTMLEQGYRDAAGAFGEDGIWTIYLETNLAELYEFEGRPDQAEKTLRHVIPMTERHYAPDLLFLGRHKIELAELLVEKGSLAEARQVLGSIAAGAMAKIQQIDPKRVTLLRAEGLIALAEGHAEEARTKLGQALQLYQQIYGPDYFWTNKVRAELARAG